MRKRIMVTRSCRWTADVVDAAIAAFCTPHSYGTEVFADNCRSSMVIRMPVSEAFDRQHFHGQNSGLWRGSAPVPVKM